MLIVDLIWIVLGIVYVVYKLIKDGEISGKSVLLSIATVSGLILVSYIFDSLGGAMDSNYIDIGEYSVCVGEIIKVIPALIIGGLMLFCFIRYGIPSIVEETADKINISHPTSCSVDEVEQAFRKCGYNVSKSALIKLLNNPHSPLGKSQCPHINRAGSVLMCYNWLCRTESEEIDKMCNEEICEQIGVPSLDIIPLDINIEHREALYKRKIVAKDYLLKKLYGVRYSGIGNRLANSQDEYYNIFTNFVNEYVKNHH